MLEEPDCVDSEDLPFVEIDFYWTAYGELIVLAYIQNLFDFSGCHNIIIFGFYWIGNDHQRIVSLRRNEPGLPGRFLWLDHCLRFDNDGLLSNCAHRWLRSHLHFFLFLNNDRFDSFWHFLLLFYDLLRSGHVRILAFINRFQTWLSFN